MTFVIDIDDTIIFSHVDKCGECGHPIYREERIDYEEILRINAAYDKGHVIIFYTGRDWVHFEHTTMQLNRIHVKYHRLVMGKPIGIYIDKEAKTSIAEVEI